ncbi:hypothetical protein BKA83DRAFT_679796 [Pisolithus microcarpus]|nr:hypothetical protein BKA83DRAFT_679796 [Pisolithus microcarpus]
MFLPDERLGPLRYNWKVVLAAGRNNPSTAHRCLPTLCFTALLQQNGHKVRPLPALGYDSTSLPRPVFDQLCNDALVAFDCGPNPLRGYSDCIVPLSWRVACTLC